jgi:transposase InsO family protein
MNERLQMVGLHQVGRFTVAELAEMFGVSRKTVYKWTARFAAEGVGGLEERSRAPHGCPHRTPVAVIEAVVRAKKAHPSWGPAKLLPGAQDPPEVASTWPAPSTRGSILARHGLTTSRRRRRRVPPWTQPFQPCQGPNAVWCADFKGWFRTGDGQRCDPVTITDAYSRLLLACQGLRRPDAAHVRPVFERLFQDYGLPLAIRTDNGVPFASVGVGGLSSLSAWWVKLGIRPERIEPGHPEQNGRHERFHGTLKAETLRPPAPNLEAQQASFDRFRQEYNTVRPHQALGQVPPASLYVPSPRLYPHQLEDPVYAATALIRRVRSNGQIKWGGGMVFVSEALTGELVGVEERKDGWLVSFGPIPLGMIRPGGSSLERLPPRPFQPGAVVTHVPG